MKFQTEFFLMWSSLISLSSSLTTKTAIFRSSRSSSSSSSSSSQIIRHHVFQSQPSLLGLPPSSSLLRMTSSSTEQQPKSTNMINLQTIKLEELEVILKSWGHPKYRAKQIYHWIRVQGVTDVDEMQNIPKKLRQQLQQHSATGSLQLEFEQISKDGTRKRAYALPDGQLIESVLMPYRDGRYTACISSQAGCAQGCVFCATGQMGFSRQLTADEIFEQVARFSSELAYQDKHHDEHEVHHQHSKQTRLSNIVFMGMGEPLANYRNVVEAVQRIQSELGIGHRKITISTVGIVPNILKLAQDLPQVRLAVSLHCASDEERSALLPANYRYGGLDHLMETLQQYSRQTGKRITLEWALIEEENDTPETAHKLGKLIKKWLRPDMVHVNVIPLNPTGGFGGSPSGRQRVNAFIDVLDKNYGIACTPRVRRGIDIDAGCGQLKAEVEKKKKQEQSIDTNDDSAADTSPLPPSIDLDERSCEPIKLKVVDRRNKKKESKKPKAIPEQLEERTEEPGENNGNDAIMMADDEDWQDYEYSSKDEKDEMKRLLSLVKDTVVTKDNEVVK